MYFLRRKKVRFLQISNSSIAHYNFTEADQLKKFIVATGLLNHVWQSWNQFWRAYWVAHVLGGRDLQNNKIVPSHPQMSEPEALYYLLTLTGKKRRGSTGSVNFSHEESTWGDIRTIQNLVVSIQSSSINVNNVLNAASFFGRTIEHFQIIRNAQIHISTSNMKKLVSVIPYYVISSKPQYPHDILEARELSSGKVAIRAWIENMNNFLTYL